MMCTDALIYNTCRSSLNTEIRQRYDRVELHLLGKNVTENLESKNHTIVLSNNAIVFYLIAHYVI